MLRSEPMRHRLLLIVLCVSCCSSTSTPTAPAPRPGTFRAIEAEGRLDYWLGDQHATGAISFGAPGRRFQLQLRTGNQVALEVGCDGSTFRQVDHRHACQRVGPCDAHVIAGLVGGGRLTPDDVLPIALGSNDGVEAEVMHADYHSVTGNRATVRLPGKTRLQGLFNPPLDVIVTWTRQAIDPSIAASQFVVPIPAGLPGCL